MCWIPGLRKEQMIMMNNPVLPVRTAAEVNAAWNELRQNDWDCATVLFHKDLLNAWLQKNLMPELARRQITSAVFDFREPDLVLLAVTTTLAGGMELLFTMRLENVVLDKDTHALVFAYEEKAKTRALVGLLGGLAKKSSGQTYLQMALKNEPGISADAHHVTVDLNQFGDLSQLSDAVWNGHRIVEELVITPKGVTSDHYGLDFSWKEA